MIDPISFAYGFAVASGLGCLLILVIAILADRAIRHDFHVPPEHGSD